MAFVIRTKGAQRFLAKSNGRIWFWTGLRESAHPFPSRAAAEAHIGAELEGDFSVEGQR